MVPAWEQLKVSSQRGKARDSGLWRVVGCMTTHARASQQRDGARQQSQPSTARRMRRVRTVRAGREMRRISTRTQANVSAQSHTFTSSSLRLTVCYEYDCHC